MTSQTKTAKKSKLPLGPTVTKDKAGRNLYWFNRKRVKEDVYWAEVELLRQQRLAQELTAVEPLNLALTEEPDRLETEQLPPEVELVIEQADDGSSTAEVEQLQIDTAAPNADAVMEKLDELLGSLRQVLRPGTTEREGRLLAKSCFIHPESFTRCAHYEDVLELCDYNSQSANALLGSLIRKGLVRYESKEEARYRLITTTDRYFAKNSEEVQSARAIEPTALGLSVGQEFALHN